MKAPRNPLKSNDVDANTIAWMQEQDRQCGCSGCGCNDEDSKIDAT